MSTLILKEILEPSIWERRAVLSGDEEMRSTHRGLVTVTGEGRQGSLAARNFQSVFLPQAKQELGGRHGRGAGTIC